jgi:DNA-binding NtrC family response regulator
MNGPIQKSSGTRVRPGRVLIVDDQALVGRELAKNLPDHEIVAVECGEDALAVIGAGQHFDLILCDVIMQGMNGTAVLGFLENEHPTQAERLVFMADRMVSPIVQYLLDGVPNLCLERPLDLDGLRALIERRIRSVPDARTA